MTKRWLSPEEAARIGEKNRKAWGEGPFVEPLKPMDAVERLLHVKGPAIGGEVRRPVARPRAPEFVSPTYHIECPVNFARGTNFGFTPPLSPDPPTRGKAQVRRTVLPVPTETSECLTFIAWSRLVTFRDRPLFDRVVKIPNERGKAGVSTAILQSIGMRAGFPDYNILAPTRLWSGLYLEAKRIRGGKVEADQMRWRDDLRAFGYYAEICAGADELIAATRKYFVTAGCDRDGTWIDRTSR